MSTRDGSEHRSSGPPNRNDLVVIFFVMCAIAVACLAYLADSLLSL